MKKIIFAALWFLSFSLTAAAYNTYAPNSWDTVKKEAWDYQAAYDLCEKGRAPDYDRNFFDRGSLTRYELASVLKNILEAEKKGSTLTDEERKKLARLKKEFIKKDTLFSAEKIASTSDVIINGIVTSTDVEGNVYK